MLASRALALLKWKWEKTSQTAKQDIYYSKSVSDEMNSLYPLVSTGVRKIYTLPTVSEDFKKKTVNMTDKPIRFIYVLALRLLEYNTRRRRARAIWNSKYDHLAHTSIHWT